MTDGWIVVGLLAAGTFALKAAGPLLLGNRRLPEWFETVVNRLPAALLAALVVTSAFAAKGTLVIDARAVGLASACTALWKKAGFVTVVVIAAAATAAARRLGMS